MRPLEAGLSDPAMSALGIPLPGEDGLLPILGSELDDLAGDVALAVEDIAELGMGKRDVRVVRAATMRTIVTPGVVGLGRAQLGNLLVLHVHLFRFVMMGNLCYAFFRSSAMTLKRYGAWRGTSADPRGSRW